MASLLILRCVDRTAHRANQELLAIEGNKGRTRRSLRDPCTDDAIGGFFAIEVIHELGAVFEATDEEPQASASRAI